jgi:hypothetical protein
MKKLCLMGAFLFSIFAAQNVYSDNGCCPPSCGSPCDTSTGECYCKYVTYDACPYTIPRCVSEQIPYTVKHCRMVPQYYPVQQCRMVPEYYTVTACRQVPEYYETQHCRTVYRTVCEQACRYVPRYYWKHECGCPSTGCCPSPAPCCP